MLTWRRSPPVQGDPWLPSFLCSHPYTQSATCLIWVSEYWRRSRLAAAATICTQAVSSSNWVGVAESVGDGAAVAGACSVVGLEAVCPASGVPPPFDQADKVMITVAIAGKSTRHRVIIPNVVKERRHRCP
nr:MAG TPA: hypothetical protein [Caudoviricetes sp.]